MQPRTIRPAATVGTALLSLLFGLLIVSPARATVVDFKLGVRGYGGLYIDEELVGLYDCHDSALTASVDLSPGWHDIRVEFATCWDADWSYLGLFRRYPNASDYELIPLVDLRSLDKYGTLIEGLRGDYPGFTRYGEGPIYHATPSATYKFHRGSYYKGNPNPIREWFQAGVPFTETLTGQLWVTGKRDLIATSLIPNPFGGLLFSYEVAVAELRRYESCGLILYWANGPTLSSVLPGQSGFAHKIWRFPEYNPPYTGMGGAVGRYGPYPLADWYFFGGSLRYPPPGATHLLFVVDPPSVTNPHGEIEEIDENNNVAALALVTLDLVATSITANQYGLVVTYAIQGGDLPYKPEIAFYWSDSPTGPVPETPAYVETKRTETKEGTYTLGLLWENLDSARIRATHIVAVIDQENYIYETDEGNNSADVPVGIPPELSLQVPQTALIDELYPVYITARNRSGYPITVTGTWKESYTGLKLDVEKGALPSITIDAADGAAATKTVHTFQHYWDWIPPENPITEPLKSVQTLFYQVKRIAKNEGVSFLLSLLSETLNVAYTVLDEIVGAVMAAITEPQRSTDLYYTAPVHYTFTGTQMEGSVTLQGKVHIVRDPQKEVFYVAHLTAAGLAAVTFDVGVTWLLAPAPPQVRLAAVKGALSGTFALLVGAWMAYETAKDPPDDNFTVIFQPVDIVPPDILQDWEWPAEGYALEALRFAALANAEAVSKNRADGARNAGETEWQIRQLFAAARYSSAQRAVLGRLMILHAYLAMLVGADEHSLGLFPQGMLSQMAKQADGLQLLGHSNEALTGLVEDMENSDGTDLANAATLLYRLQALLGTEIESGYVQTAVKLREEQLGTPSIDLTPDTRAMLEELRHRLEVALQSTDAPQEAFSAAQTLGAVARGLIEEGYNSVELRDILQASRDASDEILQWKPGDMFARPGDLDVDGDVDTDDLKVIVAARNTPAYGNADPRDLDKDGKITGLDARKLVTLFTRPGGAIKW